MSTNITLIIAQHNLTDRVIVGFLQTSQERIAPQFRHLHSCPLPALLSICITIVFFFIIVSTKSVDVAFWYPHYLSLISFWQADTARNLEYSPSVRIGEIYPFARNLTQLRERHMVVCCTTSIVFFIWFIIYSFLGKKRVHNFLETFYFLPNVVRLLPSGSSNGLLFLLLL